MSWPDTLAPETSYCLSFLLNVEAVSKKDTMPLLLQWQPGHVKHDLIDEIHRTVLWSQHLSRPYIAFSSKAP